jgi:cysteine-rich repeat protein
MRYQHPLVAVAFSLAAGCQGLSTDSTESAVAVSGAIFTTTSDGSRVNANIYPSKSAVYLDGGPGDGAPASAAGLPAGDYYFQVTDPSGHTLLSQDAITNRQITIDDDGLIVAAFNHVTGTDVDHGALTVQLMPYADTPNNGGEYKVWVISVDEYAGADAQFFGFTPRYSKTDNFKVREEVAPPPVCGDGYLDEGEQCDDGNTVDGDGCSADCKIE